MIAAVPSTPARGCCPAMIRADSDAFRCTTPSRHLHLFFSRPRCKVNRGGFEHRIHCQTVTAGTVAPPPPPRLPEPTLQVPVEYDTVRFGPGGH